MKIGLFFGSFNPIHIGHLIIASHIANYTDLEQVWFVLSPQNPLKNRKDLLNEYERLELVNLAIEDDERLRATDIEFQLPRPSYTINTLLHLEEKFPANKWCLIMGTDSVQSLPKWRNYEELIKNYEIIVYPRPGFDLNDQLSENMVFLKDVPLMEISATFIRRAIKNNKNINFLLTNKVANYIEKWGLYK